MKRLVIWLVGIMAICVLQVIAVFALSPKANADPGSDYLSSLRSHGIQVNDPADTIIMGRLICSDKYNQTPMHTYSFINELNALRQQNPGLSYSDAEYTINSALWYLCPLGELK